jgi:hypothetical protein
MMEMKIMQTVKYNKDGAQQWVRRYNGPNNLNDKAFAIYVDASGNVYVTGGSQATGKGFDYLTIKYSSSGQQLWTARYDASSGNDNAFSLKVDHMGNVLLLAPALEDPLISLIMLL